MSITKQEIALIHVAKNQTGLSDDEYRDLLRSVGVESSKELIPAQFDQLMKRFKAMGFKLKVKQPATATKRDPNALPTPAHLLEIQKLYDRLGWTPDRQIGFNKRQIKKPWPQTRTEANKIHEGLKAILARAKTNSL